MAKKYKKHKVKHYETFDELKPFLEDHPDYYFDKRYDPKKVNDKDYQFPTCKLSAGSFGVLLDHPGEFYLPTEEELAYQRAGIRQKEFTEQNLIDMKRGRDEEAQIIRWFEKAYNVHVKPVGFLRPKFDLDIGGIPDGEIEETKDLIECKSFRKMPVKLLKFMETPLQTDEKSSSSLLAIPDHMKVSHYAQMQGYLAMMNKRDKKCYYIGHCTADQKVFVQPFEFNKQFWDHLHQKIHGFMEHYLEPILKGTYVPKIIEDLENGIEEEDEVTETETITTQVSIQTQTAPTTSNK